MREEKNLTQYIIKQRHLNGIIVFDKTRVQILQLSRFVYSLVFKLRIAVEIGGIRAFIHNIIISQYILFCWKVNFINYFFSIPFMDRNFESLMESFQLDTIYNLFKYYDLVTVYRIIREFIVCPDLKSLFTAREHSYEFRDPRPIREGSHTMNYSFHSSIATLRRVWNLLPRSVRDITKISEFKRVIKHANVQ